MATFRLLHEGQYPEGTVIYGSERVRSEVTFTSGSTFAVQSKVVADNYASAILWTSGDGGFSTFEIGYLLSDQDVVVELRNDKGTAEYCLIFLKANLPFYFGPECSGSTTERLDGAILVEDTDHATIDRIEVQRNAAEAEGDANVTLFLFA